MQHLHHFPLHFPLDMLIHAENGSSKRMHCGSAASMRIMQVAVSVRRKDDQDNCPHNLQDRILPAISAPEPDSFVSSQC